MSEITDVVNYTKYGGEKRCVSGRDERGLGDWFGGQGVGRGLVEGGGKTKRFAGVKGF